MTPSREQLMELLLGQLSAAEEAEVLAALESSPELQKEYQADQDALAAVLCDLDLSEVTVPPDAESRLLTRLHAQSGPSVSQPPALPVLSAPMPSAAAPAGSRWATPLLTLLSVAAAIGLALFLRPPDDLLRRYEVVPGAVTRRVGVSGQGAARLVRLSGGQVFVRMAQAAPPHRAYQLWELRGQTPVSLGVFTQDYLSPALFPGTTVAVTVEPAGGSPQPTSTPLFVAGS